MTATANSSECAKTCDRDLATGGHPLEMFPVFRRIPRSFARDIIYTLIGNTLIAVVFTLFDLVFDPRESLAAVAWTTFVIANCIGFLIHLEFVLAIFIPRERAVRVQAAFERERARVAAAEKQATQAQLKLLEAQVEPHFLSNTLANVVSLIDADPATAKRMLDRLIAPLRGAAVAYFEANDKYTSVFTADGEALIRTPLKELLAQLDADRFWQIHRGTIVNVAHVAATTRDLTGCVKVKLKGRPESLVVSRAYAHRFRQM